MTPSDEEPPLMTNTRFGCAASGCAAAMLCAFGVFMFGVMVAKGEPDVLRVVGCISGSIAVVGFVPLGLAVLPYLRKLMNREYDTEEGS